MKQLILVLVLFLSMAALPACENKTAEQKEEAAATTTETEATDTSQQLAYICPMKCEGSASDEPGKCKVCEMDLIKNPEHKDHAAATTDTAAVK